jgi:hypothetical protein
MDTYMKAFRLDWREVALQAPHLLPDAAFDPYSEGDNNGHDHQANASHAPFCGGIQPSDMARTTDGIICSSHLQRKPAEALEKP